MYDKNILYLNSWNTAYIFHSFILTASYILVSKILFILTAYSLNALKVLFLMQLEGEREAISYISFSILSYVAILRKLPL